MVDIVSETTVSVNFVDYGSSMKLPTENLRPITLSLLTLPFQAVRCSLAGTVSVKMCSCGQYRVVYHVSVFGCRCCTPEIRVEQ